MPLSRATLTWILAAGCAAALAGDLAAATPKQRIEAKQAQAKAVLTIDNGILHLASAAGAKTVGLFRHGIHRLWAPPFANLTVLTPGEGHEVAEIEVDTVMEAMKRAL